MALINYVRHRLVTRPRKPGRRPAPPSGNDGDADELTVEGTRYDVTVQRFEVGIDTVRFTGQPADAFWTEVDQGLDQPFTRNGGQRFTITGAERVDPSLLVSGLTYNAAPTYVGGTLVEVGSLGALNPAGPTASTFQRSFPTISAMI